MSLLFFLIFFFFFNDTATTEIYTLSLHDALPIFLFHPAIEREAHLPGTRKHLRVLDGGFVQDRKSTRLNSSHGYISYAVFCLKKKKTNHTQRMDFVLQRCARNYYAHSLV